MNIRLGFFAVLISLLGLIVLIPATAFAGKFFSALYDIPLMPDMVEVTEKSVIFDTIDGRIAESSAEIRADTTTEDDVKSFYFNSLSQMGWQLSPAGHFIRNGEKLVLTTTNTPPFLTVTIRIEPNPES